MRQRVMRASGLDSCRSADGLVTQYIVGDTLTEADMHADGSNLPATIAPKLAAFHGPPQQLKEDEPPILWCFLDAWWST